jgi:hypothetical protein
VAVGVSIPVLPCVALSEQAAASPRHGFYWPIGIQDAVELVKTCWACQFHAKQIYT